jgi:hypothetical protein
MDFNELRKEIHDRFDRVSSRLAALNKEREQLETEHDSLIKLVMLYDSMPYDSITEERRVTECILKAPERLEPVQRRAYKNKGRSQYDEPLEVIFTSVDEPMTLSEIHSNICSLTGKHINMKNMSAIMNQQIDKGNIKRIGYGKYAWGKEE